MLNSDTLRGTLSNSSGLSGSQIAQRGPQGRDGLSAYEVAVKDGYVGTEEQWLESLKGEQGNQGNPGQDGDDGISPTVEISKVGKVTTITITDADGVHTATINDGADGTGAGDMLKSVYDTDDDGIVDNAEKVNNHTVEKDVPSNAVFTDTVYDDTSIRAVLANKVDKVTGKGLSEEDFTTTEKTKLNGIESGAQVNTVTGVKGDSENDYRTGNINITKANIGLGNVDNKSSETIKNEYSSEVVGADAYDNTSTYAVGDYCIYNNTLYKCNTAITVAEAWNSSHWTATSIAAELANRLEFEVCEEWEDE